jgi:hypothetical protein
MKILKIYRNSNKILTSQFPNYTNPLVNLIRTCGIPIIRERRSVRTVPVPRQPDPRSPPS